LRNFVLSTLSVLVCLAVAVCSSQAFRLPIKPPPFLENQVDQWKEDAAAIRDRLEQELQKLRDEIKGLLGGCKNEETTAAPEPTTTTQVLFSTIVKSKFKGL